MCLVLDGVDPDGAGRIDSGDGSEATIRRLMRECLAYIGPTGSAYDAVETREARSMIHSFLCRLIGVGVGTIRRLRRPTVEKLEPALLWRCSSCSLRRG